MKRPPPQTLAVVGVLVALAVFTILTAQEAAPDRERFASTDYAGGGYRAWSTLLVREGIVTERFVLRPIELDDRIDTLISAQPAAVADPSARTAADIAALAVWVRGGGRLVYVGRSAALAEEAQLLELPYFLPGVGPRGRLSGSLAGLVKTLPGLGTNRMLLVEHPGRAELADENGDVVVRYPFGRGEIVAVSDGVPFTNANIAGAGNARLAYVLGVPRRPGGTVAFDDGIHGALIDRPWYRALPNPVRVTLGILACAALLTLIGSALPGALPVRLDAPREPTSVEYVDALAALYERTGARSAAADALARDALSIAAQSNGMSDAVAPAELAARIGPGGADILRLAALRTTPIASDAELIAAAKLAHTVRKEWNYGGYGDGRRAAFTSGSRTRRRR